MKKQLFLLTLFAALCLTTGVACCQQAGAGPPAQPMFCQGGGPGAISGDGQHLYVAEGGKVLEYKLEGMTLEHAVDLSSSAPPAAKGGAVAQCPYSTMPPPPPDALWAGGGKLYVLAGPVIYVFKTPELTLEKPIMLPGPKPPNPPK